MHRPFMASSDSPTVSISVNESIDSFTVSLDRDSDYWFDLPLGSRISSSIGLIISLLIGSIGKFAVIKRILTTGLNALPMNPLMFYNEIVYTAFRVSLMSNALVLFLTGIPIESYLNFIFQPILGTNVEYCSWYYIFVVFAKNYEVVGSWSVAIFR